VKPILVFTLFAFLPSAYSMDASVRGNARGIFAADTEKDDDVEHLYQQELRLFAEGRASAEEWSGTISFLLRHQLADPNDTKQSYDADLYEAYVRWASHTFSIEAGQRVVRWGVMEYVSPTDAINPRDLRLLIDPEVEDTYLPVLLFRSIVNSGSVTFEGIYQPFFRSSRFFLFGWDAAIYRPSLAGLFGIPFVDAGAQIDDGSEEDVQNNALNLQYPDDNPLTGEGGLRIGWSCNKIDVGVLYLNKRETLPSTDFPGGLSGLIPASTASPSSSSVISTFPRDHLVGATVRAVLDNGFTLKGEALYQHEATYYDSQLNRLRDSSLIWSAGVDYDWELRQLFTLEFSQDRVLGDSSPDFFLRDRSQYMLSPAAVLNFDARTWTIELKGTTVLNQAAYLIRPRLIYRPTATWELALGGNVWGGDADSLFGLVSNDDQVFVAAKVLF